MQRWMTYYREFEAIILYHYLKLLTTMTTSHTAKIPRLAPRKVIKNDDDSEEEKNSPVELTYDVLTIIFKHLNAKDLQNAAIVCRCWQEISMNEQKLRNSTLSLLGNLNDSWKDLCPGKNLIDLVRTKPMLSFAFTRPFDSKHPAGKRNNSDCPCKILPSNCLHLTVGNYGIVKDQIEFVDVRKAIMMFLPRDNGVCIDEFYELPTAKPTFPTPDYPDSLARRRLRMLTRERERSKCFIVFSNDQYMDRFEIVEKMPRRGRYQTLAGCMASDLWLCQRNAEGKFCSKPVLWIAILISGVGLRSWSAVLRRSCNTKDKVEEQLVKLRKQTKLKKYTMGFMFACQGRGETMFGDSSVESGIFKKVFPEIPLVGCFGGGEYGISTIEHMDDSVHAYSTVFLILTYG